MRLEQIFDGPQVTREELLESRTGRAERQRGLLDRGCPCLISMTLNLPGAVKQFPLARAAFQEGVEAVRRAFPGQIREETLLHPDTGSEGLFVLDLPPEAVKRETVRLEESHPLGRLFDLDVLGPEGVPLSRKALGAAGRRCLLCGEEAKGCARSGRHAPEALLLGVAQLLSSYFRDREAGRCGALAVQALLYEVSVTPKPGLVDRNNAGAHRDMDYFTFLRSSAALGPWMEEMFRIGWDAAGEPAQLCFQRLRAAGQRAEEQMYEATGGANTHMGLIFSMGILCGALGKVRAGHGLPLAGGEVLEAAKELGGCALRELAAPAGTLPRASGARGEAALGFPTVVNTGLPALRLWTGRGLTVQDAGAAALLALLALAADTNMVRRGGAERAEQCRAQAADLLGKLHAGNFRETLEQLDREYIQQGLSPGGCADLLCLSLMLFFLEERGWCREWTKKGLQLTTEYGNINI